MAGEFEGRIVVVTGGSRGIGRAIAEAFAREGAQTIIAAQSAANLEAASRRIAAAGHRVPVAVAADLRRAEGCAELVRAVETRFGRCDVLVNPAGATRAGDFLKQADAEWEDGFALKFYACVRLCRALWPMLKTAEGHVVNVIGGAARTPDPEFLIGGAVNAAMANFTKGLAGLGRRDGVNVNAIHPGLTETERVTRLFEQRAAIADISPEEARTRAIARDGLRRIGQPEDSAELALFLCSERARHIQGTAIAVDGGATPGLY